MAEKNEQQIKNPIQVADRLFATFEYLAQHGPTSLTELSEKMGLSKSTEHRIITSLSCLGYVTQNPENSKYTTTYKIVSLAESVMSRNDIVTTVRPYLNKLMQQCDETVHFVRREGAYVVYIDKVESLKNNVRMISQIGMRLPFYRTAVGKIMVCDMPVQEIRDLWDSLTIVRTTPYTITDFNDFLENLEDVRKKGYALDNEENESGLRCIAMSLSLEHQKGMYAFSISVPISRMDNDRIKELSHYMIEAKSEIEALFK